DERAVPLLAPLLESEDTTTRDASLLALAKIANQAAQEAVVAAAPPATDEARGKFDQALLLVAHARAARDEAKEDLFLLFHNLAWKEVDPATRIGAATGVLKVANRRYHLVLYTSGLKS